jgi:hypothetical protein
LGWLARRRAWRGAASALLLAALVAQTSSLSRPAPPRGARELAACETAYQFARIVEDPSTGYRFLQVNEGFDSFQSAWRDRPGPLGEGYYYDLFALPAWWSGRGTGEWRVLVLGAGTDSVTRVLEGAHPEALELASRGGGIGDRVADLGAKWMDAAPSAQRHWLAGVDARAALRLLRGPYDEIVIDAYANQVEIPAHLCSREFFEQVFGLLAPGGWLALNVGGFTFEDPVVAAVAATLASACGRPALALRVPAARNFVVFARRDAELPDPERGDLRPASGAPSELVQLVGRLELPSSWRRIEAGAALTLTDDRNPIEALQHRSLESARTQRGARP